MGATENLNLPAHATGQSEPEQPLQAPPAMRPAQTERRSSADRLDTLEQGHKRIGHDQIARELAHQREVNAALIRYIDEIRADLAMPPAVWPTAEDRGRG